MNVLTSNNIKGRKYVFLIFSLHAMGFIKAYNAAYNMLFVYKNYLKPIEISHPIFIVSVLICHTHFKTLIS